MVEGLPREVIDGVRRSLTTEKNELLETLKSYNDAKSGDFESLKTRTESDLGDFLIAARIIKGWSQKDLAKNLGLREQAIQRYEADRYRSISLGSYLRFAKVLSVRLSADLLPAFARDILPSFESTEKEALKVLKHARAHGWLQNNDESDENGFNQLIRHMTDHVEIHGTPSLLRTGLNVVDHTTDWLLLCWKAQITRRAKVEIEKSRIKYSPLNVSWLIDLVRLSKLENGPRQAKDLLLEHGIILIIEPQIQGMKVDGAAFLIDQTPVIGMTLLRDSIDNFWFTLLHEIGHVILHYRTGLSAGFFDDTETTDVDELEEEANKFSANMLIPEEVWSRSPARISKTAGPIEHFAEQLGISPAIVFGRVRLERKNYAIFSDKIGRGKIRKQFLLVGGSA
ncbi:ImmA/IrrE family metallo-endopeptidase [Oxalobacteraceae sp. CFBP 8753]|nr:ImmA/IrrE family metallo-endopeptidase [Oxalobacteraceae sp. CFBP 8753]